MKIWYDLCSWLKKMPEIQKEVLYCNYSHCQQPINDKEIAYDGKEKKIYHSGGCALLASADRAGENGFFTYASLEYISQSEALQLKSKGELKQPSLSQSSGLEERLK